MSTNNQLALVPAKRTRSDSPEPKRASDKISPFIAVEFSGRRVIIVRNLSYADTLTSIKKAFKELKDHTNQQIQLFVKLEQLDEPAQAVEELWAELLPSLLLVNVVTTTVPPFVVETRTEDRVPITILTSSGNMRELLVSLECTTSRLKTVIWEQLLENLTPDQFKLKSGGNTLQLQLSLAANGVEDEGVIQVVPLKKARQTVV